MGLSGPGKGNEVNEKGKEESAIMVCLRTELLLWLLDKIQERENARFENVGKFGGSRAYYLSKVKLHVVV